MTVVKRMERGGKRALMRAFGALLRARPITPAAFRSMRFERILVVRQHNQMGDMMLAVPALRAIRETRPDAMIGVVTSTLNRDVLVGHPYVDRVHTYDKRRWMDIPRLIASIRREHYDLAIVLHTVSFSFTTLMAAVLSGARVRIGSTSAVVGDALTGTYLNITLPLPTPEQLSAMNEAEHNLFPLRHVGMTTDNLAPVIVPGDHSRVWADAVARELWTPGLLRLAVHPGAGKAENIWPAENFAAVVSLVAASRKLSVVALEGPRDANAVAAFRARCPMEVGVVRGRPIADVAAFMATADLVLCNDTGVMHVGAAAGARTLAIFGKTDPARWAPRCENLHVIRSPDGTLSGVTVEIVAGRVAELVGE